jgi:hypothetical protein
MFCGTAVGRDLTSKDGGFELFFEGLVAIFKALIYEG